MHNNPPALLPFLPTSRAPPLVSLGRTPARPRRSPGVTPLLSLSQALTGGLSSSPDCFASLPPSWWILDGAWGGVAAEHANSLPPRARRRRAAVRKEQVCGRHFTVPASEVCVEEEHVPVIVSSSQRHVFLPSRTPSSIIVPSSTAPPAPRRPSELATEHDDTGRSHATPRQDGRATHASLRPKCRKPPFSVSCTQFRTRAFRTSVGVVAAAAAAAAAACRGARRRTDRTDRTDRHREAMALRSSRVCEGGNAMDDAASTEHGRGGGDGHDDRTRPSRPPTDGARIESPRPRARGRGRGAPHLEVAPTEDGHHCMTSHDITWYHMPICDVTPP